MLVSFAPYAWCGVAGLCSALATVMMKISATQPAADGWLKLCWLAGAVAFYVVGFGAYNLTLAKLEITVAYPMMTAVTMSIVAVAGCLVLGESINGYKVSGMLMLCAGAVLLSK
jgi:multidrug transporter EmrE-like cation transporter